MDGGELGHFSLLEKIGEGGMGRVYKARDKRLDRFVAIKLLAEARSTDADRRARFVQEAKAASALNHPNIITIHEIGEQDGQTYIVMELVDGKPLNELIPRKGMRLTEALRIAAQVAGALAAAHAAGIVHRDLKPANIMVDAHGRAKVLDFGLAKLAAPAPAAGADEATRTLTADQPVSEEGVILGTVPYMSPEQVEGKPVDARSDIFSFGAVLYEMITGQRAFRGESKISTLAAVVEKDPPPISEVSVTTPPEVERLIGRCLRKDVNRRSQNMADVKLALEELRDESESGKLARPAPSADGRARGWRRQAVVAACVLIAAAAFAWISLNRRGNQSTGPDLVRVSPDDGHSYSQPAISPNGEFVAYLSDRSGKIELWLQQVGGGEPIQLTHATEQVDAPAFFPDGKRILYERSSADQTKSAIEAISTLGGEPQVLIQGGHIMGPALSPDGRQISYSELNHGDLRLVTTSSDGGQPRELPAWKRLLSDYRYVSSPVWTADSRYLLCWAAKPAAAENTEVSEWFALPVDGGRPVATGAGEALRAAGLAGSNPRLMTGDRVLFIGGTAERSNTWEIRLSPDARVQGVPHQLTFGTVVEGPASISATGTLALQAGSYSGDFYLIPLSAVTGQPTGIARRLTQDGRNKHLMGEDHLGGDPASAYFSVWAGLAENVYAIDLDSGKQILVARPHGRSVAISPDGRRVAYSVAEGDSYSIRLGEVGAGPAEARVLCKACGLVGGFSPDGRYLLYSPEVKAKDGPNRRMTVRLLELASGKDRPWLEHATDSVSIADTFNNGRWLGVWLGPPGSVASGRVYLVPWREEPVPLLEWIKTPWSDADVRRSASPTGNFVYFFEGSKLMTVRFDPQRAAFSAPQEVKLVPGSAVTPKPDDDWAVRGPGLVFSRRETGNSSVWLMKLPH